MTNIAYPDRNRIVDTLIRKLESQNDHELLEMFASEVRCGECPLHFKCPVADCNSYEHCLRALYDMTGVPLPPEMSW